MPPDTAYFAGRIETLAEEILPAGTSISDKAIAAGAVLLEQTYEAHGDKALPSYKSYHNHEHPLTVLRRDYKLLTIMQTTLPDRFDDSIYDLSTPPTCGHDLVNTPGRPAGENETDSAVIVRQTMLDFGYSQDQAQQGYDMVEGTAVERDEKGAIVQNNLRRGSNNPLKWALANADINGIPMEGIPRMVSDAFDLYLEFSDTPVKDFLRNPAGAAKFFQTQAQFLEDRLAVVDEDLSYYFSDEEKAALQAAFTEEFTGKTRDAISAARMLFSFPEVPELIISSALSKVDTAVSSGSEQLERVKLHVAELLRRTPKK